ncbi:MAG: histidine ammonia-lyase [Candidatus Heimdallarchaeaceae archaeon]
MSNFIVLNGNSLNINDLIKITRQGYKIRLSDDSKERIRESRNAIENLIAENDPIYGVSTGFGKLANVLISINEQSQLQENIIRSHSISFGEFLPDEIVKGAMVIAINSYCKGSSGIRLSTVELYVDLVNNNVIPLVPSIGSLGASGDLAPLSYIASVLIGEGKVKYNDQILTGKEILAKLGLEPISPVSKEGLSLVNGTHVLTSFAAHTIYDSLNILKHSAIAVALVLEALHGNTDAFSPFIMQNRKHKGQSDFADTVLKLIKGSDIEHIKAPRVQDPYSIRCSPQVHGAVLDTIRYVKSVVEVEMNSATDNPLISVNHNHAFSGGNFHGEPISLVMDFLSIALTELGSISERRVNQLLNTALSGLPAFLTGKPGLNSGLMILQYADAALSAENKILSTPASIDNTPVSADQEDHVSMGLTSSKKVYKIRDIVSQMIAIEIFTACQALEFRGERKLSPVNMKIYNHIRKKIPPIANDRRYDEDVYWVIEQVKTGGLLKFTEEELLSISGE